MKEYTGACQCGAIRFSFKEPDTIERGLRCNCSICRRKSATMSQQAIAPEDIRIAVEGDALGTYTFGDGIAKHHFCKVCGIYPFHQTKRQPGWYRVNLGCVDGVDVLTLPYDVFDGASL